MTAGAMRGTYRDPSRSLARARITAGALSPQSPRAVFALPQRHRLRGLARESGPGLRRLEPGDRARDLRTGRNHRLSILRDDRVSHGGGDRIAHLVLLGSDRLVERRRERATGWQRARVYWRDGRGHFARRRLDGR